MTNIQSADAVALLILKGDELTDAERDALLVSAYRSAVAGLSIMSRPGVTFTPEQVAAIQSLSETEKTMTILCLLNPPTPDGE